MSLIKTFPYRGDAFALLKFFGRERHVFWLDSSLSHKTRGRYSILGFDPFDVVAIKREDPFPILKKKFARFQDEGGPRPAWPLVSGMVGYLAYDAGLLLEDIPQQAPHDLKLPNAWFGCYDVMLVVDHGAHQVHLCSSGFPELNRSRRQQRAQARLHVLLKQWRSFVQEGNSSQSAVAPMAVTWRSNFTQKQFEAAVRQAQAFILAGDIYQVNLAQRFAGTFAGRGQVNPVELYGRLRAQAPSYFGSYLDCGSFQILSSSPEEFLSLRGREVLTWPMKGTRPRGESRAEDQRLKKELARSAKDRAELLMITDLERNDLGRVCDFGSVRVRKLRTVETYRTVHQGTSTVAGRLRSGLDGFDLLRACFPGGSITGCPKIRAMKIIETLEPVKRGIYSGAFGYVDFSGDLNFNILIRTLIKKERNVFFHVGSGIVADSTPDGEYQETLVKARSLFGAFAPTKKVIILDSEFIEAEPAFLDSLAPGKVEGDGVFETMRSQQGRILFFDQHQKRLVAGLKALGIRLPANLEQMVRKIKELLKLQAGETARVRWSVWRWRGKTHWAAASFAYQPPPPSVYHRGWSACLLTVPPAQLTCRGEIKSLRYAAYARASQLAASKKVDEALFVSPKGHLIEGSRVNLFWFQGKELRTPALTTGCLNGVTRRRVLALARRKGYVVREGAWDAQDLRRANEAFVTNALIGLMPLSRVNGKPIGSGKLGRLTADLRRNYERITGAEIV